MTRTCLALALTIAAATSVAGNPEMTVGLPGGATIDFVWIEPGTFIMGSPTSKLGHVPNEAPQHAVTISRGFWLGKCEVTQVQWQSVMATTPWWGRTYLVNGQPVSYVRANSRHPAVYVSWDEAQQFIGALNAAAGSREYRLPTEAEWEYACRSGTSTRWSFGDDDGELDQYAWYKDNAWDAGEQYAHAVGTKQASPWGLHDMHGNVWEWCQDWYERDFYASSPSVDPAGPASGVTRVIRGGSVSYSGLYTRSAYRNGIGADIRDSNVGLRLLMTEPASTSVNTTSWGRTKRGAQE